MQDSLMIAALKRIKVRSNLEMSIWKVDQVEISQKLFSNKDNEDGGRDAFHIKVGSKDAFHQRDVMQ